MDAGAKKKVLLPIAIVIGLAAVALLAINLRGMLAPQQGVISGGEPAPAEETAPGASSGSRAIAPE